MSEVKHFVVFYDVDKPQVRKNALVLKVDSLKFNNLMDEAVPEKNVELKFNDGAITNCIIVSRQNFWTSEYDMINGQVSNCFLICVVKKIKV